MEPVGVRVCRETKQVSYKISCWFNFSAVVGNSLICISQGKEQSLKEGLEAGIGNQGLVPPSQHIWAVSQQRGAGWWLRSCCKHRSKPLCAEPG